MVSYRFSFELAVIAAALLPGCVSAHATILGTFTSDGYIFTNFDPTLTSGAAGSNANGISNTGQIVGTEVNGNNTSVFTNYVGTPNHTALLNIGFSDVTNGINSAGTIVGGNGTTAFVMPAGATPATLPTPANASAETALGINDHGGIVGTFTNQTGNSPGFYLPSGGSPVIINGPSGLDTAVNAQGINNHGQIIGFYVGTDGQTHGFTVAPGGTTGIAIPDPTIPVVPAEPGATFVFSQLLGINDGNLAVGYYGDSTTSQHGFVYNLKTNTYTFLDDPAAAFSNGVEVTQITGISNIGELSGFYTDGSGIAHSFAACPVGVTCPGLTVANVAEPGSLAILAAGLGLLTASVFRRKPS